tara:strand:+ start:674 stop:1513 length:840 start_codon:yes stop_codon:yes gene_type:complete
VGWFARAPFFCVVLLSSSLDSETSRIKLLQSISQFPCVTLSDPKQSIILKPTKPVLIAVACLLLVWLVVVLLKHAPSSVQADEASGLTDTLQDEPQPDPGTASELLTQEAPVVVELPVEQSAPTAAVQVASTLLEKEALVQLLPAWMHEEGVDFYFEEAEVMGETVTRCRGRYLWENGAQMEYELTDVGPTLKLDLIKGLGFNFDQENTESESGYTSAYELKEGVLLNHEYDEAAGEGSLQVLVDGRFLLEVQLEGFEAEAFEDVLENNLPLDELLRLL